MRNLQSASRKLRCNSQAAIAICNMQSAIFRRRPLAHRRAQLACSPSIPHGALNNASTADGPASACCSSWPPLRLGTIG
eukprot:12103176-Alexandrium_andersonii.AAC.1